MMNASWSMVLWYTATPKFSSSVQHFAAGVVFAAVATDLIPIILSHEIRWLIAVGFAIGVAIILSTKWFAEKISNSDKTSNRLPTSL